MMRVNSTWVAGVAAALHLTLLVGMAVGQQAKPLPTLPALQAPVGVPQRSTPANDPLIINLQLRDPNDPSRGRYQKVSVDYARSAQNAGESDLDYASRLTIEKAKAIADATNALVPGTAKVIEKEVDVNLGAKRDALGRVLRDQFGRPVWDIRKSKQGYVEFTNLVNDPKLKNHEQLRGQQITFGEVVTDMQGKKMLVGANPTGEPGGGVWGRGASGPIPPPPGMGDGSMGKPVGDDATGLSGGDFPLESSVTSYAAFGVYDLLPDGGVNPDNMHIAAVDIFPGQTGPDILTELWHQLLDMGVAASYDPLNDNLSIDSFALNQALWWNDTDTGLQFSMGASFEVAVPEPATLTLVVIGVSALALCTSRRPRPWCRPTRADQNRPTFLK